MNLGKRIESRLKELGWERKDLLDRVPDLTPQRLSALIRRDSRRCELDFQIATALGVTVHWLNDEVEPKLLTDKRSQSAVAQGLSANLPTGNVLELIPQQSAFMVAATRLDRSNAVSIETKEALTELLKSILQSSIRKSP